MFRIFGFVSINRIPGNSERLKTCLTWFEPLVSSLLSSAHQHGQGKPSPRSASSPLPAGLMLGTPRKKPEAIRLGVQAHPPPSSAQHTEYTWSDAWQFCATCGICKLAVLRPRIIFPCRGRGQGSCLARRCCPCRQCSGFFSLEPVVVIAGVRVHRPRHEDSEASHPSSVLSRRTQNRRQRWARC